MRRTLALIILVLLIANLVSCEFYKKTNIEESDIEESKEENNESDDVTNENNESDDVTNENNESDDVTNENKVRVFANCKDVEELSGWYAEYDSQNNYVILPLLSVIPFLGATVSYNGDNTVNIKIAGYSYVLELDNDTFYRSGDKEKFSLIMPAPGSVAFFEKRDRQYMVSDNCLLLLFRDWDVSFDFDKENMTYTLTREN